MATYKNPMNIIEALQQLRDDLKLWVSNNMKKKANKATTLEGYNITNAYTKTETNTAIENTISNANVNGGTW